MRTEKKFKESEIRALRAFIREKSGYYLGRCLLLQAFVRRSYTARHGGENNEVLELIGDSVLDQYVIKSITKKYGALNHDGEFTIRTCENRLSVAKSELVNNKALAAIIDEWGLAQYLVVGQCDADNSVDEQEKVKADLFEAIVGAIAVHSKWNAEVLEQAVSKMLGLDEKLEALMQNKPHFAHVTLENAVTVLKELAEHQEVEMPTYDFSEDEDSTQDKSKNPLWSCTCRCIGRTGYTRMVYAPSKKLAKQAAAYLVLCEHYEFQNEYEKNGKYAIWRFVDGKLMPYQIM